MKARNTLTTTLVLLCATLPLLSACSRGSDKAVTTAGPVIVKTMTATTASEAQSQTYPATIEATDGTSLSFASAGTISRLTVSEGDFVKAGQLIGTLDASSQANATRLASAATRQAQETLNQANDALKRMQLLHDNGSLPEIKWVEVQTKVAQAREMLAQAKASEEIARKGETDTRLVAPSSGYIVRKKAEAGENVLPGQSVADLVRIDQIKVSVSVPEDEIAGIKVGQRMTVEVPAAGTTISATVSEKSVVADPISRSYTVKATAANPSHRLLPGMVCNVRLSRAAASQGEPIALPANVIQIDADNRPFVWTVADGKARLTHVTLGANVGDYVTVTGGLTRSDQVIVEGQQKVSSNTKVKVQ